MTTFAIRNLGVLAYFQGFTLWGYQARATPIADTQASGFFNPCADMLAVGDRIMITGINGACDLHVASNVNGHVTVVPLASTVTP